MELILWRHAEAEDGFPDRDRRLTERGQKQAKNIAAWLRARIPGETKIVVSPAVRAQQTAQALSKFYVTSQDIDVGASVQSVLQVVRWPRQKGFVVVVGHQPTLGCVAAYLLSGREEDWVIKKGAIWWIVFHEDHNEVFLRACLSPNLL